MMVKSFLNSFKSYYNSGFMNVNNDVALKRISICKSCDKFNEVLQQCKECGCFLQIKTAWATEKCPLDKWGSELINSEPTVESQPPPEDCGCNKK